MTFIANVLNELKMFDYKTNKKATNSLSKNITEKKEFEYYPVDFFQTIILNNYTLTQ